MFLGIYNFLLNISSYFTATNVLTGIAIIAPIGFLLMTFTTKGREIARSLWGSFENREELKKFLFLAFIFFIIIGVYWSMRPIKDSIFGAMVGYKKYGPWAKLLSLALIVPLIIIYNKLIDKYPRQKLFYILFTTYAVVTLIFMGLFLLPSNQAILLSDIPAGLPGSLASPWNIVGWLWYVFVESYGSMLVALFWAFSSDITKAGPARRGFPLIFLFGQLGNVLGPLIFNVKQGIFKSYEFATSAPLLGVLAGLMLTVVGLLWLFVKVTPERQMQGFEAAEVEVSTKEKKEKAGFLDGLKLLLRHKYLLGMYCIIMFYEVIVTMFDYSFKALCKTVYPLEIDNSAYLFQYATWTGIISATCVFVGINNIQRKLGMKVSLILMPLIVFIAWVSLRISGSFGLLTQLVFLFWVMVFSKAINYALNQPTLKQAYIPTSKDSKYKAQSWIEMFGGRSSKGIGSTVNLVNGWSPFVYMIASSVITLGLIGVWIVVAMFVAGTYNKAIKENKLIC